LWCKNSENQFVQQQESEALKNPHEDDWPFFPTHDIEPESICSKCLESCKEESLTAIIDVCGVQHFCCDACHEELKNDFIGEEE
jgi:hypothetical protein